jgi:hypothetical protein
VSSKECDPVHPRSRHVVVLLRDGRELDGVLVKRRDHFEVEGVRFYEYDIDDLIEDE